MIKINDKVLNIQLMKDKNIDSQSESFQL